MASVPWEKQFDRDQVLERCEHTLWAGGYEATSMETLLARMGIQKGSFYATFGSKHNALIEALHRYIAERFEGFAAVERENAPLDALERHFDAVLAESAGEHPDRGCFVLNCALELAPRDRAVRKLVQKTLQAHEAFLRGRLQAARETGSLPAEFDVAKGAITLLGFVLGMRVMARAMLPLATIRALRDQAVETFRAPHASGMG